MTAQVSLESKNKLVLRGEQEYDQDRGRRRWKCDLSKDLKMPRPVNLCRLDQHLRYLTEEVEEDQYKDLGLHTNNANAYHWSSLIVSLKNFENSYNTARSVAGSGMMNALIELISPISV